MDEVARHDDGVRQRTPTREHVALECEQMLLPRSAREVRDVQIRDVDDELRWRLR